MSIASVEFRETGLPERMSLGSTSLPAECARALRALSMLTELPVRDVIAGPRTMLLPMTPEFAACSSSPEPPQGMVRVGSPLGPDSKVEAPKKLKDATPLYPASAQQQRIEGVVIIEARIGVTGCVAAARVIRSIPELDVAALAAVQQWQYTPTLVAGTPAVVVMTVTVTFRLR